jgi:hypothetical protein
MFGLITSLAGLPLINVVSLGAGAVFGGKTLRDESENRLQRRQAAARATVQRHVEDFFLKFSKDCKDVARQVHRSLRDHFSTLAEDLQESLIESARLAKQAAETDAARWDRRQHEIRRELDGLGALHGRVLALGGVRGLPGRPGMLGQAGQVGLPRQAGPADRSGEAGQLGESGQLGEPDRPRHAARPGPARLGRAGQAA